MTKRFWIASLAAICASACATTAAREELARERLRELQGALPANAVEVEAAAREILADTPTASIERGATHVLAAALADQGRCDELLPDANEAASSTDASAYAWRFAFSLEYECEHYDRAAALLSRFWQRYPDDLSGLPPQVVFRTAGRSRDAALLAFLINGGWRPNDPALDMGELRLSLIRAHLANGDQEAAAAAARDLINNGSYDFGALVVLLSDRTFDTIIEADPARFDVNRIIEHYIENSFAAYSANPRRLSTLNALAGALQLVGRADEASALIDDALARQSEFADQEQLNWAYQVRSNLRAELGLEQEALKDLALGAEQGEDGRVVNVSQRLNRAGLLLSQERPAEALREAQRVDPAHLSPYGRSVRRYIIVCSNAALGLDVDMRAVLAEAAANASDSYMNLQAAAECAGDLDLAAQAFVERLDDPIDRRGAIISLQGFAGEPAPESWLASDPLYSRADVQAAIARAMHIRTFPIRRP